MFDVARSFGKSTYHAQMAAAYLKAGERVVILASSYEKLRLLHHELIRQLKRLKETFMTSINLTVMTPNGGAAVFSLPDLEMVGGYEINKLLDIDNSIRFMSKDERACFLSRVKTANRPLIEPLQVPGTSELKTQAVTSIELAEKIRNRLRRRKK